jgi:hypothetical protein
MYHGSPPQPGSPQNALIIPTVILAQVANFGFRSSVKISRGQATRISFKTATVKLKYYFLLLVVYFTTLPVIQRRYSWNNRMTGKQELGRI